MKRREFIRLGGFLTVSVATLGVTGCDIVGDNSNSTTGGESNQYPNPVRPMPSAATGGSWQFPQSVASGDPKSDSIILWTRVLASGALATDVASADIAINLKVTAADNSASLDSNTALTGTLVADVLVPAYVDFDGTVRHKLTGLDPDTVYYYQFTAGTVLSRVGRFKTAPAASATRDIKFAFMSCQDWSANHWGAFTQIVNDDITTPADLDFVVHLGDYIYETDNANVAGAEALHGAIALPSGTDIPPERVGAIDPPGKYATTTNDYRYLYKLYRSDSRIQRMHERFPMVAVWDDHEFSDDAWQESETYTNSNQIQYSRRRAANQCWFEYMPADITFQEINPSFQNITLYRDLQFGQTMHLVMTDERLYRQDHLIPENTLSPLSGTELGKINSRYLAPEGSLKLAENLKEASQPNLALISMLGATQRQWWKSTMSASTATWKVWGNEVSLLRMGLNGTNAVATLLALGFVSPLASSIGTAAGSFSGSMTKASAYVGAVTFLASSGTAAAGATAIDGALASGSAAMVAAGMGAGLSSTQAQVAVTAYLAAYAAAAGGAPAQASAGAQAIAIGSPNDFGATDVNPSVRNDIRTNKSASIYYAQALSNDATTMAKVAAFLQKFVVNADQWDGYRKERTNLMDYLLDNSIQNVVSVTGDLHAFFAGTVYNEFAGEVLTVDGSGNELTASTGDTAAMVDLVAAGVSSTSWFNFVKAAADTLDPTNSLIGKLVYVPINITSPAPYTVYLNLLDYTLGRPAPASPAELAAQLDDQIKRKLASFAVPEGSLDAASASTQAGIAADSTFQSSAYPLAVMLAKVGKAANPWLNAGWVNTEAQGYAVVTASHSSGSNNLVCQFKKLNPLVNTTAPSASRIVVNTKTATVAGGVVGVTVT